MSTYYSPLRYPGGKGKMGPLMSQVLNDNNLGSMTYIEPFAGGAGVGLFLLLEEYVEHILINDADYAIWCFWRAILEDTERFIYRIREIEVTIRQWHRQKEVYTNPDSADPFDVGFAVFFLNRTNRSGIANAGPIGGLDQSGTYHIAARFNKEELCNRILRIGCYADRVRIMNIDGIELLSSQTFDERSFIYLDPPYYIKGGKLYLNRFSHSTHTELSKRLKIMANTAWILTYDNAEEIKGMYTEYSPLEFDLSYSLSSRRRGSELLFCSPSIKISEKARSMLIGMK